MADDRPVEDPTDQVGRLQRELDDLRSTVLARVTRRPTGDVEATIRSTPKDGTLLMQGQAVSRTTYANLWAWAQEQGLVIAGLFTTGDGTSTFGLPDMRGRVPIGAGTLGADVYAVGALGGASAQTLTVAQMPKHNHPTNSSGFTSTIGDHGHGTSGFTNVSGDHDGHNFTGFLPQGPASGFPYGHEFNGSHNHTVVDPTFPAGGHNHTIDASNRDVGGSQPFDNRPPYLAVNWLVWA